MSPSILKVLFLSFQMVHKMHRGIRDGPPQLLLIPCYLLPLPKVLVMLIHLVEVQCSLGVFWPSRDFFAS